MTAIAAVLFDLDDTLLDAESAWRLRVRHMLTHRVSGAVGSAQAEATWGEVFDTWFDRFLTGGISLADSHAGRMRVPAARLAGRLTTIRTLDEVVGPVSVSASQDAT